MSTNPTPLSDTRFEAWYLRRIEDGTLGNSEGGSFGMDMIALAFRDAGDEARERVRVLEDAVMRSDSLLSLIWHRGYLPWLKQAELREEFNEVLPMLRRFRKPARAVPSPTEEPPTPEASR